MGEKSGRGGKKEEGGAAKAKAFVLKVHDHDHCRIGCPEKIRAAVNNLTRLKGIVSSDLSELESKGEVRLLATADPEMLRQRLHKDTGKKRVELVFPEEPKPDKAAAADNDAAQQQQQQQLPAARGHGGRGAYAYPPAGRGHGGGAWHGHGGGAWHGHGGY